MIPVDLTQTPAAIPVNMFFHPSANNGKPAMVGLPGYVIMDSEGTGMVRGAIAYGAYNYFVINDDLYIFNGLALTSLVAGFFSATGTTPVKMAAGDNYIVAIDQDLDEVNWYKISDGSHGRATLTAFVADLKSITYQDGYYITTGNSGGAVQSSRFYISSLNDPNTWSALDFEDCEFKEDSIIGLISSRRLLYIFGYKSIEIYENTGNSDFPFERIPGGALPLGCAGGSNCIIECNGSIYFIGDDKAVYSLTVNTVQKVSTPIIDKALASINVGDAIALKFIVDGMWFCMFRFTTAGVSYVLNTATGLWSKFMSGTDGATNHPAICIINRATNSYVGLASGGSVAIMAYGKTYEQSDFYSAATKAAQYREVQTQVIDANRERMFMGQLEVWAKKHVGTTTVNPTLSVSWSDDMGSTWSTARTLYLGLSGGTGEQLRTFMLGNSYNRIFKFYNSNIYELQLYGGYLS